MHVCTYACIHMYMCACVDLRAVCVPLLSQVEEDLTLLDPEENSSYYMDILVESLQNLGTIDSALTVSC